MEPTKSERRSIREQFPKDFPERLERFNLLAGLSWRGLARLFPGRPYWPREWPPGAAAMGDLIVFGARRIEVASLVIPSDRG